jgi:hypothetical protein
MFQNNYKTEEMKVIKVLYAETSYVLKMEVESYEITHSVLSSMHCGIPFLYTDDVIGGRESNV